MSFTVAYIINIKKNLERSKNFVSHFMQKAFMIRTFLRKFDKLKK